MAAINGAKHSNRLGQRELFAYETGHETPTAYLSPGFQPAQDAYQVPPAWSHGFPGQQLRKHESVPSQELAGPGLDGIGFRIHRLQQRPPAVSTPAIGPPASPPRIMPAPPRTALDAHPQRLQAIRGYPAGGGQQPQGFLNIGEQPPGGSRDVGYEGGASLGQDFQYLFSGAQRIGFILREWVQQPVQRLP